MASTTVDYEALAQTGYIDHYHNPSDPYPNSVDWFLPEGDEIDRDGNPKYYVLNPDSELEKWFYGRPTDIDELHEAAGRGCYAAWSRPNPATQTNDEYLRLSIIANQHESVLEHGTVTLFFDGLSRWWLAEIERHRHLSLSVLSTRFVDQSDRPWAYPPAFNHLPQIDKEELEREIDYVGAVGQMAYARIAERLGELAFKKKQINEAARFGLISSTTTAGFMTANIRHWKHIIRMRNHPDADAEIREFARLVLAVLVDTCPSSVQDLIEEG